MQKLILIFTILLSASTLYGQVADYAFSGDFDQVSFDAFVESLEESSGLNFFYLPEWTSGVTITAKGEAGTTWTELIPGRRQECFYSSRQHSQPGRCA